jgi:hypothetical protein
MNVSNFSRPCSLVLTQLTQATYLGFLARRMPSGLFKYGELSARIQFLHSTEVSQPPRSSFFHHSISLLFIVERVKFINVSCSPYTIVNLTAKYFLIFFFQKFGAYFHLSFRAAKIHFRMQVSVL